MKHLLIFFIAICLHLDGCASVNEVIETDPDISKLSEEIKRSPYDPRPHLQLALLYSNKYKTKHSISYLDQAIHETREALLLAPDFPPAHGLLSTFLIEKAYATLDEDLIDESKNEYEKAIKLNPDFARAKDIYPPHIRTAQLYLIKSVKDKIFIDRAIQELKESVRLNPNVSLSHFLLGGIYEDLDNNELALFEFNEAARLDPDNPEVYAHIGNLHKTGVHSRDGCLDESATEKGIAAYREAAKLDPHEALYHRELGWFYRHKRLYDMEVFEAREALRLENSHKSHKALGDAFLWKGEFEQAVEEYLEAIRLQPRDIDIIRTLAFTYFLLNKYDNAVREFTRFLNKADLPDTYALLWKYLSLKEIGKDIEAGKLLDDYTGRFKGKKWESLLINYHQGAISESDLISGTRHKCDKAEAYFYIGYNALHTDNQQKAREFFQKTLDTHVYCYYEYAAARAKLAQLDAMK